MNIGVEFKMAWVKPTSSNRKYKKIKVKSVKPSPRNFWDVIFGERNLLFGDAFEKKDSALCCVLELDKLIYW